MRDVIAEGESEFYAITEVFLNGNRAGGGQGRDGVRSQETNLANPTGDANLAYGQAYDDSVVVSVKNGGGIRASIGTQIIPGGGATEPERLPPEEIPGVKPLGGISSNDVGNVLAFNNGLVLLTLTTEELVGILEVGVSNFTDVDTSAGGFLHFAGIRFSFDRQLDPGSRVVDAAIVDETNNGEVLAELVVDGEVVKADATHRIITLDFLAREDNIFGGIGTDRIDIDLGNLEPSDEFNAIDTFANGSEQDALAEYLFGEFGPEGDRTITEADVPQEFDTRIVNVRAGEEPVEDVPPVELSVATFNVSMNRGTEGELVADLSDGDDAQAQNIAEIIQRNAPDILLLNEFDFDADGNAAELFQDNYLSVSQNGAEAIDYAFSYVVDSNTGVVSGFDLNNDGTVAGEADRGSSTWANDGQGFGSFPGQFAFVIYSQYEIDTANIRTFQEFLWKDMPDALLFDDTGRPLFDPDRPFDPENPNDTNTSYYTQEEIDALRLSSKNHVDVPILVDGETTHLLAAHPTPPVFDGVEDRNGKRNHDEVRFWADYVAGEGYIVDDNGVAGGLAEDSRFVIVGDYNVDPFDGDSVPGAAQQLLTHPLINGSVTEAPAGQGGIDKGSGGFNDTHGGNPAFDTADFGFNSGDPSTDNSPGNLRVDYVLPSHYGLEIEGGTVVWPGNDDPFSSVTNFPTSDHRMVINDLLLIRDTAQGALGSGGTFAAVDVTLEGDVADATFAPVRGGHTFSSDGATLSVLGAETISFSDETVEIVDDAEAATLARAYEVAFDRFYDIAGMSYWFEQLVTGAETLEQIGNSFLASSEWQDANGGLTNAEFVDTLIGNALPGGLGQMFRDDLLQDIAAGRTSRGEAILEIANEAAVVQGLGNLVDDGVLTFV
ncbi:MAG: endonuclease/exonuclease/phosphatase family protein [Pseudomonadota bacterium]